MRMACSFPVEAIRDPSGDQRTRVTSGANSRREDDFTGVRIPDLERMQTDRRQPLAIRAPSDFVDGAERFGPVMPYVSRLGIDDDDRGILICRPPSASRRDSRPRLAPWPARRAGCKGPDDQDPISSRCPHRH